MLDGFDLGVGVLHLFTKDEEEKRMNINAIGPVWDGNEVWLLTGGGALFAAFPPVYATAFSGFYLALMLLLAALIARAVSMEFRGKVDSPKWRNVWDWAFGLGSFLPALLFGVAVGNVLRGVPIDSSGEFVGTFLGLLNPYALLIGVLSLVMFTMHGALYLVMKTEGEQQMRAKVTATRLWPIFVVLYILATVASYMVSLYLFEHTFSRIPFWVCAVIALLGMTYIPIAIRQDKAFPAFIASSASIAGLIGIALTSMFPKLLPSSVDLAYSLTAYNASSTPPTLTAMLIIALIGMPLVLVYTFVIYRVFKGKVVLTPDSY
ncbi:MAG: cytochrome d ubiquinol oxidase subunit II [Candidatus Latescibacterota bacterium]